MSRDWPPFRTQLRRWARTWAFAVAFYGLSRVAS